MDDENVEMVSGRDGEKSRRTTNSSRHKRFIIGATLMIVVIIVIVIVVVVTSKKSVYKPVPIINVTTLPTTTPNPSPTAEPHLDFQSSIYSKAAVAADAKECSDIGKNILLRNGTAVDAAVAGLFCLNLFNMHSCGIGGGGFMTVYIKDTKKAYIYDFRETAPAAARKDMYINSSFSSVNGPSASGVPGNVRGLHHAWKKHGKLPWRDLLQPTIDYASNGFPLSVPSYNAYLGRDEKFMSASLKDVMKANGSLKAPGTLIKMADLAATLKRIADDPEGFYNGSLARDIVDDLREAGLITIGDLQNYTVVERSPLVVEVDDLKFYLMPPPGSGAVVGMILNILKGYRLSSEDAKPENLVQTFHKVVEAFKFAYARRALLGDPAFLNKDQINKVLEAMLNASFCEEIRSSKISLNQTHTNVSYYGGYYSQSQSPYGTSHLSVLSEAGDAVAVTDTINYGFGSGYRSNKTGIIYNNEMDDFSTPGLVNLYGYPPTEANFIAPGKRPLSSMSPTIVVSKDGYVKMVVGASGGSRIITATSLTLIRALWLKQDVGNAVSLPRVHHQLTPNEITFDSSKPFDIAEREAAGLRALGHTVTGKSFFAAVQAIYRHSNGTLFVKSDPRKGKGSAGY